jgi:hypothetical protein
MLSNRGEEADWSYRGYSIRSASFCCEWLAWTQPGPDKKAVFPRCGRPNGKISDGPAWLRNHEGEEIKHPSSKSFFQNVEAVAEQPCSADSIGRIASLRHRAGRADGTPLLRGCGWQLLSRLAAWNPRQVSTQNVDGDRRKHEDRAYPKAPVTMHSPPVRAWIGFASVAAVSFEIVLVSCHFFSAVN